MIEQFSRIKRIHQVFSLFYLRAITVITTLCLCAVFLPAQSNGIITKDSKAKEAVDAAHKALGGADKIDSVKSIIMSGTGTAGTFDISGETPKRTGTLTFEFEIRMLLPDNILTFEKTFYGETTPTTGITYRSVSNGGVMGMTIYDPASSLQSPPKPTARDQSEINWRLWEMARLLVGTLMKAGPMPLTITSGSIPERFTITEPAGETCEVEFDAQMKYPSIVRYTRMTPVFVSPATGYFRPPNIIQEERELVLQFQEWLSIDGIMFPRVITEIDESRNREMRIEKIQINPNLTMKDFEIPKQ